MQSFPNIDPDAQRVLTFDFNNQLDLGEVLSGGAVLQSLVCSAGVDPNPMGIIAGPATYDSTGRKILQPVANMGNLVNNDYEFEMLSYTTETNKRCVLRAILPVRIS